MNQHRGLGDVTFVGALGQSIARFEGFFQSGSVAARNHNPGNLRAGTGQVGTDASGYAIFADDAAGFAALDHQIDLNVARGLSLDEFFAGKPGVYAGYAPSGDANNPTQYAETVAGWMGIDPTVPLASLSPVGPAAVAGTAGEVETDTGFDSGSDGSAGAGLSVPLVAGLTLAAVGLVIWAAA
jgi:hypothetical protein